MNECKELFFYHVLLLEDNYKYFDLDTYYNLGEVSWKLFQWLDENKDLYFDLDWGTLHLEMKTPNEVLDNIWRTLEYEF